MQTQKYDIKVAFEKVPHMQDTYRRNHPHVEIQGDVCAADYADIKRRYGDIDVVIGGPPCQGFSNANRQKNTAINQNNKFNNFDGRSYDMNDLERRLVQQ